MEKKEIKEWRYIVPSGKGLAQAVKMTLSKKLMGTEDSFDSIDDSFFENVGFVTAVPIEIALTMPEREHVRVTCPNTKWIITGVKTEDLGTLQNLGFILLSKPIVIPEKEIVVDGQSYKMSELKKALNFYNQVKNW